MPNLELEHIQLNIERDHCTKQSKHAKVPSIIAKFNDWHFHEMIKTSAIKTKSSLNASQMFSHELTICRNKVIPATKELKDHDKTTQAYVQYPEKLMAKKHMDVAFLHDMRHEQYNGLEQSISSEERFYYDGGYACSNVLAKQLCVTPVSPMQFIGVHFFCGFA